MFGFSKRRKEKRYLKTASQVHELARQIFEQLRPQFVERNGELQGPRLGQAAVDKLFGRAPALDQEDATFAEHLAAEIATENETIRDAAFISLHAMLDAEGEINNFAAERRVVDTIQWLKQFGEMPRNSSESDALERITETICGGMSVYNQSENQTNSSLKVLPAVASEE